jgi:hypothetical protein
MYLFEKSIRILKESIIPEMIVSPYERIAFK